MGGEKPVKIILWHSCQGSPPRGRGKVCNPPHATGNDRITPAWAGKRRMATAETEIDGDHPRVGGEKLLKIKEFLDIDEDHPRVGGEKCKH